MLFLFQNVATQNIGPIGLIFHRWSYNCEDHMVTNFQTIPLTYIRFCFYKHYFADHNVNRFFFFNY